MSTPAPTHLEHARELRKNMTPFEQKLWYQFLRHYPVKFYKQRIIGNYIVDFYCSSAKLAIEIDGSQHYEAANMAYDETRTAVLAEQGIEVLRFSNADINCRFDNVTEAIDFKVKERRKMIWGTDGTLD